MLLCLEMRGGEKNREKMIALGREVNSDKALRLRRVHFNHTAVAAQLQPRQGNLNSYFVTVF